MKNRLILAILFTILTLPMMVHAQGEPRWLGVGSLHNFYMSNGSEREHALVARQQYGLRWPAIHPYQDMQAAKAFWIGTKNFTDAQGNSFPFKVVHMGPRNNGNDTFFPIEHKSVGRFDPPQVFVDQELTFDIPIEVDEVDPGIDADRMIVNVVNTSIGLTMERKILQFSQEHHDNYHIWEYTFTNTGNVNNDTNIELPNTTLQDVMFFWQYRYSVLQQTRYVIGNSSGWGINSMVDRIGDGLGPDYGTSGISGHFAWHGKMGQGGPAYDNTGGPVWTPSASSGFMISSDTTGRLGAYQFVGNALLHADTSPSDPTHDPNQPFTMTEVNSDDRLTSGNDQFNPERMQEEYERFITAGRTPRHAYLVEPSGDPGFFNPTGDPSRQTTGGWSAATGIGPYTIAPGESVRIVLVEAAAGIDRELANETGRKFKNFVLQRGDPADRIDAPTKNQIMFQGRDKLMETFMRAKANFESGYNLPREPRPPIEFLVNSAGDGIYMEWDYEPSEVGNITGFEVYRARGRVDSTYRKIADLGPNDRAFVDDDSNPIGGPIRGESNYYYIQAVGNAADNNGAALTPAGALRSNKYYAISYDRAFLKRPPGETMDDIRVVPNPFVRSAASSLLIDNALRIAFYEVPGRADISIYTELGELVEVVQHRDNSGDAYWNLNTKYRQRVVTGVYIAVIKNVDTGETTTRKFVVIM